MKQQPPSRLSRQHRLAQEIACHAVSSYLAAWFAEGQSRDKLIEIGDMLADTALCQFSVVQLHIQGKIDA